MSATCSRLVYEDAAEPHLAEIAHHFFEAAPGGDVDRAVEYAQRAADHAVRLLAYEEGARLYTSALEALELKPVVTANERCELLLGLGEAQARAGDESAALATFMRMAEIARSAGLPAELARAALGYSGRFVWMSRGLGGDPLLVLEDALSGLGEEDSALRARVLARLAGSLRDQPEPERRNDLSAEAVAIARRLDDHAALAYALDGRYSAIWGPHNIDERLPLIDEILTLADEVGDQERTVQARFYRAVAYFELCQMTDLYAELEEMERVVNELRQPAQRWYVAVLRAILALFEGEFELASRELIPSTYEIGRTLHSHMPRGSFRVQSFLLDRERGRIDDCVVTAEELREWPTINAFECFIAIAYIEAGRQADARSILNRLAGIDFDLLLDNDKLWGWCVLAEASATLGEADQASRLYELLEPYAERNAVCHPAAALGSVARYLGLAAAAVDRHDDAERHFEAALAANERMGARPWLAHTQEDFARMLFARGDIGDSERAQRLLDTAIASYRELGMEGPLSKAASVATR